MNTVPKRFVGVLELIAQVPLGCLSPLFGDSSIVSVKVVEQSFSSRRPNRLVTSDAKTSVASHH